MNNILRKTRKCEQLVHILLNHMFIPSLAKYIQIVLVTFNIKYHLKAFCTTVETSFMNCSSVLLSADFWGVVEVPGEQGSSLPYNFFDYFLLLGVFFPSDMTALTIILK